VLKDRLNDEKVAENDEGQGSAIHEEKQAQPKCLGL